MASAAGDYRLKITPDASAAHEQLLSAGWGASDRELHALVGEAWAAADQVQGGGVLHTPLLPSPWLARQAGAERMLLKLENQQVTGSFKSRGAVNKVASLTDAELVRGLVACSSGNFAAALLHACAALQRPNRQSICPKIYLPSSAAASKVAVLAAAGADVVIYGKDVVEAELEARRVADATGAVYCSPYNDLQVAGGAGTCALELLSQLRPPGSRLAVFVPVGGGGLISGVAAVLKSVDAGIAVVGCQPAASDVMRASVAAGRIVDQPSGNTLSDGSAGGVEPGALTFEPCVRFVDDWVTASEPEIAAAMLGVRDNHGGMRLEGSAAMAVACAAKYMRQQGAEGRVATGVVVCCGGNVADSMFEKAESLLLASL